MNLRYPSEYRIPVDSDLAVEQLSALSEPYVEIAPVPPAAPSSPPVR